MSNLHLFKKHATHFTEQVKMSSDHLDEVKIAGEIKSIVLPVSNDINELSSYYVFHIDDSVGDMFVYVTPYMKSHYDFLQVGNLVAFSGYVNILRREVKNEIIKDVSIVAYEAQKIKKVDVDA